MDLKKIMTISGKSGLFVVLSETRNGLLVESLSDGRKTHVFPTDRSSLLADISIFTNEGEVPLKEVLWKLYELEDGKPSIDPKSDPEGAKARFEEAVPEYDTERVYFSDIKKVFAWYGILLEKDMISKPEAEEEQDAASEEVEKTDADKEINNDKEEQQAKDTETGK
jgi:hypothetical protein